MILLHTCTKPGIFTMTIKNGLPLESPLKYNQSVILILNLFSLLV